MLILSSNLKQNWEIWINIDFILFLNIISAPQTSNNYPNHNQAMTKLIQIYL
jgi:hypothetical protein